MELPERVLRHAGRLEHDLVEQVVVAAGLRLDGLVGDGVGRSADLGLDAETRRIEPGGGHDHRLDILGAGRRHAYAQQGRHGRTGQELGTIHWKYLGKAANAPRTVCIANVVECGRRPAGKAAADREPESPGLGRGRRAATPGVAGGADELRREGHEFDDGNGDRRRRDRGRRGGEELTAIGEGLAERTGRLVVLGRRVLGRRLDPVEQIDGRGRAGDPGVDMGLGDEALEREGQERQEQQRMRDHPARGGADLDSRVRDSLHGSELSLPQCSRKANLP
ncbi:MAG: hypothetical protein WDM81_03825 [Rhizomicrobium sp.]